MSQLTKTLLTIYIVIATIAAVVFGYLYFKDKSDQDTFELTIEVVGESISDLREALGNSITQTSVSIQENSKTTNAVNALYSSININDYFYGIDNVDFSEYESHSALNKKAIVQTYEQYITLTADVTSNFTESFDKVHKTYQESTTNNSGCYWKYQQVSKYICLIEIYTSTYQNDNMTHSTNIIGCQLKIDYSDRELGTTKYDAITYNYYDNHEAYEGALADKIQSKTFSCKINDKNELIYMGHMSISYTDMNLNSFRTQQLNSTNIDQSETYALYADMSINKVKAITQSINNTKQNNIITYFNDIKSSITDTSILANTTTPTEVDYQEFSQLVQTKAQEFSYKYYS